MISTMWNSFNQLHKQTGMLLSCFKEEIFPLFICHSFNPSLKKGIDKYQTKFSQFIMVIGAKEYSITLFLKKKKLNCIVCVTSKIRSLSERASAASSPLCLLLSCVSALLPLPLAPLPLAPLPLGLPLPLPLLTGLEVELVSLSNLSAIWRKPGRLTGLELPLLIYRHQSYISFSVSTYITYCEKAY